ncbi:hypothetical protein FHG87_001914 [Trinorchestia longiramus]|nr:hypothetical protein FHG87_001914 [Trinorchestia longiramus]
MPVPDYEEVRYHLAPRAEDTNDCSSELTSDQESNVEWDTRSSNNPIPHDWKTVNSDNTETQTSNLPSSQQKAYSTEVSNSSNSVEYITVHPDHSRVSLSKNFSEPIHSTFRRHASVNSWLADEVSSAPPTHRFSVGVAFVPLSDRIPSFIREHHASDFVLMATPKELKRSGSCERNSRSSTTCSQKLESPYFEGGRRSSLVDDNEEFEYCSTTEPLQGPSRRLQSLYHRNLDAVLRKQARQLRKPRPKNTEPKTS